MLSYLGTNVSIIFHICKKNEIIFSVLKIMYKKFGYMEFFFILHCEEKK
jgi:hypothetical protein